MLLLAQQELDVLFGDARFSATDIKNKKKWEQFAGCSLQLGCANPLAATPGIVVTYLLQQLRTAKKAKMRSHAADCPNFRLPSNAAKRGQLEGGECVCPAHHSVGSLKNILYSIQAGFRDRGRPGDWDELAGTGNPCRSKAVERLLSALAFRETNNTVSAPVRERWTHHDIQLIISAGMEHTLRVHQMPGDPPLAVKLEGLRALSATFFVMLSWASLDRGLDVLELVMNQFRVREGGGVRGAERREGGGVCAW